MGWFGSGSVMQDHSDHGRANEPTNPCPEWIHWFIWSTIIRVISDHRSLILIWIISKESTVTFQVGFPVVQTGGHKVTGLPKFLRWIDYQHFLVYGTPFTGSSAMIYTVVKTSLWSHKMQAEADELDQSQFVERSILIFFILPLLLLTPTIWFSLDCGHQSQKCSQGEMIPLCLWLTPIKLFLIFTWS